MARTTIDLSRLPPPDAVQVVDYEAIWAEVKADIVARAPEAAPALELESDLFARVGQAFAYRVMLKMSAVNQAVRAVMPALATGGDLDQIGLRAGIQRLELDPGNPAQNIAPTYESDDDFRRRVVLAPEGFSVAGPSGAYEFHALSADGDVKDASAISPAESEAVVTVLSRTGDGAASPELLATVEAALTPDDVRPMCDFVTVQSAAITPYVITATIRTYAGPDPSVVMAAAQAAAAAFVADAHRLGRDINRSSLYAALTVEGVMRVDLTSPAANIVCDATQAAFCTAINLTSGGVDE